MTDTPTTASSTSFLDAVDTAVRATTPAGWPAELVGGRPDAIGLAGAAARPAGADGDLVSRC